MQSMSPTTIAAIVAIAAVVITLAGTWYAWRDYRLHPDRYGYRSDERQRQFTTPDRGVTHQPSGRWSASDVLAADASTPRPRIPAG
jgi:hypothetical protein